MRAVVLGPPASGKGTQAVRIAERYGVPHLSTGALFRREVSRRTDIGRQIRASLARGDLVPDPIVFQTLFPHLKEASGGWILDGFPRTRVQAETLDDYAGTVGAVDAAVYLEVDADELLRRMRHRAGIEGRADDTPETMNRRLADFRRNSAALISHYAERGLLTSIDANPSVEEVTRRIFEALDSLSR